MAAPDVDDDYNVLTDRRYDDSADVVYIAGQTDRTPDCACERFEDALTQIVAHHFLHAKELPTVTVTCAFLGINEWGSTTRTGYLWTVRCDDTEYYIQPLAIRREQALLPE